MTPGEVRSPDRAAWLADKAKGVGSSDAPAICGLSTHRSVHDVWLAKVDPQPEPESTLQQTRGMVLEPYVAEEWARRAGVDLERCELLTLTHPEEPWRRTSPDAFACHGGWRDLYVEVKTSTWYRAAEWGEDGAEAGDGVLPDEYMVQVQHGLDVSGLDRGVVVVALVDDKFWTRLLAQEPSPDVLRTVVSAVEIRAYPVQYDGEFYEAKVLPKLRAFWDLVQRREPPDVDGSDGAERLLAALYPRAAEPASKSARLLLPESLLPEFEMRERARLNAERWSKLAARADQRIEQALGEHKNGACGPYRACWYNVKGKASLDRAALEAEQPEIVERYTRFGSGYRALKITKAKGA